MTDDVTERMKEALWGIELTREFDVRDDDAEIIAQALLPTVRELQAGVWDEGYESGNEYGHDLESHWARGIGSFDTEEPKNPYREAGE